MEKIALITDSTGGIPKEYINKFNINLVNLKVIYQDKEYIEGVTITAKEVYDRLDKEVPTTSMPSVSDVCNLYEKLIAEGYTHAIVVTISSGLSGTINSFRLAASQYEDKINSFVFDSKSISMGSGALIVEAGRMLQAGKDFDYICNKIVEIRENTDLYFSVETLSYLIKGGRIGKVAGGIGEMLNLKPIITMDNVDGKYTTVTKVRGSKQSFHKLVKLAEESLSRFKCRVVIATGNMYDEVQKLQDAIKDNENLVSLHNVILSPVAGIHSGPKLLGIIIFPYYEY
ncbi:MAG: DegV family protein [Inconstantimicrobium porci]|uniref:DegV family protein n=1 Tax=Inconstantimicrobium porci TaxID=2652291 RepID=A0A7X2MZZ5_9CLOT|nr:DegV family protein [Inconstantimicrobium porci]MDD6771590.1 DegV family protein [Inconstantimicrobium porci]MDY5910755.1 DegV family protein [Inconstantimicrobium porci]MSR92188.1 DegV family protein [Inconstantimicrobium porci]